MVMFLWWCFWGGVLWWCFCGGVLVVVFLWWCFCGGVFVLVFLWWCFCGVLVVVFLCWCFRGGVSVVVFLWWCFCCGVFVVWLGGVFVFLWWCFGSVFVVFLWWCSCAGVFVVVFLWCSCGGVLVVVFLWLKRITSETMSERRPSSTTPYYASTTKASKTSISCEASATFQGTSFQNEHFVRCFPRFSQNEVPKRAFRAMLRTIFTEKASKRIVSCEASSKFQRRSFKNERFVRGFLQISQNHASKTSVSHDASDNFARKSFQNDRFVRGFFQISQNKLPKRAFRAMLPTIFTKNLRFATVSRNRHTASCERVHPPKAKCASHYNAVHSQM